MSATAQNVPNDISLGVTATTPIIAALSVANPGVAVAYAMAPLLIMAAQQVIAMQSSGTDTSAQLAAEWAVIKTAVSATHNSIQAFVALEEKAHAAASVTPVASVGAPVATSNVVTGPTPGLAAP